MDKSIENVTLYAGVIVDVLKNYESKKQEYKELFDLAAGYDLSNHSNKIPLQVYIQMCDWIEMKLGKFNLIRIGRNIGESTYDTMLARNMVGAKCSPLDLIKALIATTLLGVQDPKKRGWEIVNHAEKSIQIRKTQNFNPVLQIGLLDGLVRKSGVLGVQVRLVKEVRFGAEFDEYLITWL